MYDMCVVTCLDQWKNMGMRSESSHLFINCLLPPLLVCRVLHTNCSRNRINSMKCGKIDGYKSQMLFQITSRHKLSIRKFQNIYKSF